jgi:UDP-glucose 4-epimerase
VRAIVTGGAGFIGSHVANELIAAGAQVLILDNFLTGRIVNVQDVLLAGAGLVELDIGNQGALERAVASFRPEVIFHFAAQVDVRSSVLAPAFDAQPNIIGSINIFSAAAKLGVRRVVNASTGGAIYGEVAVIPTTETDPAQPIAPYGLSKLAAETYAQWFRQAHGLDVVTLRFGNVYGARQDPARGAVVARFCEQVIRNSALEIFGPGDATRDYLYVADAVAVTLEVGRRARLKHSVYNVSSGRETSVRQLARAVAVAAGRSAENVEIRMLPARPGEVSRNCLNTSRAREEGLMCLPTTLDSGIRATLDWMREVWE